MFTVKQLTPFSRRHASFAVFFLCSLVVFWKALVALFTYSLSYDYASHIVLVLPTSAVLIYWKRKRIFSVAKTGFVPGTFLLLTGIVVFWIGERRILLFTQSNQLSVVTLAIVTIWIAGFVLFYGTQAFCAGRFPLLFLLLLVPIPAAAIEKVILFLQAGSAWVAYKLLQLLSIPVFKQEFELRLPTLDVEVARECSGIRSSLALLISVSILSHFVLRSTWRKVVLMVAILPILILKNAVRIVTICLLSMYVDRRFLHGWLHLSGGIVFYILGLLALIPIVHALRKPENDLDLSKLEPAESVGLNTRGVKRL